MRRLIGGSLQRFITSALHHFCASPRHRFIVSPRHRAAVLPVRGRRAGTRRRLGHRHRICTEPVTETVTAPLPASTGSASSDDATMARACIIGGRGIEGSLVITLTSRIV